MTNFVPRANLFLLNTHNKIPNEVADSQPPHFTPASFLYFTFRPYFVVQFFFRRMDLFAYTKKSSFSHPHTHTEKCDRRTHVHFYIHWGRTKSCCWLAGCWQKSINKRLLALWCTRTSLHTTIKPASNLMGRKIYIHHRLFRHYTIVPS